MRTAIFVGKVTGRRGEVLTPDSAFLVTKGCTSAHPYPSVGDLVAYLYEHQDVSEEAMRDLHFRHPFDRLTQTQLQQACLVVQHKLCSLYKDGVEVVIRHVEDTESW